MRIMSIALGGCLRRPPIALGLTADTGGHLTYLWGAADALSKQDQVEHVEIVTRLINEPMLGCEYARPLDEVSQKLAIRRIATDNTAYLSKEAATADRPGFIAALLADMDQRERLPDVVHAHFADAAEVAIAIRSRFGIPFIYTAHSLATDKKACGVVTDDLAQRLALEDQAIAAADAIIASSRDEAERQLMHYPSADAARIWRVTPGAVLDRSLTIGSERARAAIAPFLRNPERPVILAIARPVFKKNLPALVDIYAGNKVLRQSANLVIIAGLREGPESGESEQRAVIRALLDRMDAHGLYGSLALPKRHEQDDIASYYALARESGGVFVNPALTEPYGLTLTEAAHHGVPVVATNQGGAADIVAELGHGRTADPRDHAAFGSAIAALLTDRDAREFAAQEGRERVQAQTWEAYADRFIAIAHAIRTAAIRAPAAAMPLADDLLLADIDNTLTGCRTGAGELVAYLAERPRRLFGIATGRSLQEARRILEEWHYPDPAIWVTSVGTEIAWMRNGLLVQDTEYADHLAEGWDSEAIDAVIRSIPGLTRQPPVEQRRFKSSWFASDQSAAIRLRTALMAAGLPAKVIFSHGRFLDILPERSGKGGAMRWVADRLGLPLSAVHAAGDSGNDWDMLSACPNAIVVANHSAELASLIGRPGVRVTSRSHAGGVLEALSAHDTLHVRQAIGSLAA